MLICAILPACRAAPVAVRRRLTSGKPRCPCPPRAGAAPTPEQTAKIVTDKRKSPPGQPDKAEITLRLVLPRAVLERLSARAIREGRNVEAVVAEILGGEVAHVAAPSTGISEYQPSPSGTRITST